MTPETIGVVGAGQMGAGIAHVAALAGKRVVLVDVTPDLAARGLRTIERNLARQVDKGKVAALDREAALARVDTQKAKREADRDRAALLEEKGADANASEQRVELIHHRVD